jgi:hypothetical protein
LGSTEIVSKAGNELISSRRTVTRLPVPRYRKKTNLFWSGPMQADVLSLFAARKGHFRFESGHHGDLWLEISPAYFHPNRLRPYAAQLAGLLGAHQVEAVCGPLAEGAFLAQMVAEELGAEFYFAEQFARPSGDGLYPVGSASQHFSARAFSVSAPRLLTT